MIFLWRAGWQGKKDCGFTTTDPNWSWRPWYTGLLNGIILGILTMGMICTLTTLAGIHRLYTTLSPTSILIQVLAFLLSALVVGFFEETVVRGILFRVLARIWRAWPAAVLSSLVFAMAHFIEPSQEAFIGSSFLSVTQAVFVSTFTMFLESSQPGDPIHQPEPARYCPVRVRDPHENYLAEHWRACDLGLDD